MATTALQIGDVKLKFMTLPGEPSPSLEGKEDKHFLNIELRECDEDFIPMGPCSISLSELDEETYHKKLRIDALEKGHFVESESTDHEWNPNYNPADHIIKTEDGTTI